MVSFAERKIEFEFRLGPNQSFTSDDKNTVTVADHRASVSITQTTGRPGTGQAQIRIFGLTPSVLNKLASLNNVTAAAKQNTVIVRAGEKPPLAVVFEGQIMLSQADMGQQPDTSLNIMAIGAGFLAVQKVGVSSYPGGADAAVILQDLARKAKVGFVNHGATKILSTPYYTGDAKQQIEAVARDAEFEHVFDSGDLTKGVGPTLHIWPAGGVRGGLIPLISPETGMVGYPSYSSWNEGGGIAVTTVFNSQLRIGAAVKVQSSLPVANGTWGVFFLAHDIECMTPDGKWFTQFKGAGFGDFRGR